MDKTQEIEAVTEVGGVLVKVIIGGAGLLAGALAGGLLSELVGVVIPNLRRNRVEKLLQHFAERIANLEETQTRNRMLQPEFIDLFEDGCVQASRALDDDRIEQLSTFLQGSLTAQELDYALDKRLITLLGELNRVELILLQSHAWRHRNSNEFLNKHQEVFRYTHVAAGASPEESRQADILEHYTGRLVSLGLLGPMSSSSLALTLLGSALLKKLQLEDADAIAWGKAISPLDPFEKHESLMRSLESAIR